MIFPVVALLFSALAYLVSAAPIALTNRDVWAPPIIRPSSDTVWVVGSKVVVTWDTSTRPAQVTNPQGTLLLGFLLASGKGGENLDVDHPLAKGFNLNDGNVTITVPEVANGPNYIVALIGDSGNISPEFTITHQ